jgi:DNA-binding winged helix-turn-helix (wHTH) protein
MPRDAIGDSGETQHLIKTLPRKGFRFVGAVQEAAAAGGREGLPNSNGASLAALLTPPLSIVVLPFANIGGGPEQDYFVDGVTECLTTDLSRIGGSFVIAHRTLSRSSA